MSKQTKAKTSDAPVAVNSKPKNLGKVLYRYKPRRVYGVSNPQHLLYDGMLDSTLTKFTVRRSASGGFVLPLSDAEKKWIMSSLNLSDTDLNVNDRDNEYLTNLVVELPKGGLSLDTESPWDFLQDRILSTYDNVIAPSTKTQNNKRSYRFIRMQEIDEGSDFLEDIDVKKAAYKRLGNIESSREKMIMLILLDKVRISPSMETAELRVLVNKMADSNPRKFLSYVDDPLFVEKGILNMGVLLKKVDLRSGLYYFEEQPLAAEGAAATFTNAGHFLADGTNSDIKLALSNSVLDEFNRTK